LLFLPKQPKNNILTAQFKQIFNEQAVPVEKGVLQKYFEFCGDSAIDDEIR
jgi:hypothetical protein